MIRLCPNCANKVIYDVSLGALSCDKCGGIFDIEEFDEKYAVPEEDDLMPVDNVQKQMDDAFFKEARKQMMDVSVYTCSTCGAEVIISGTEISTFCVYCGNPTIVFSRIRKINRPDAIIPFSVPKDAAEMLVRAKIRKGLFVPKAIKNFKVESLVGLYIPYHINDIMYRDTVTIEYYYDEKKTKNSSPTRFVKTMSGQCHFDRLTTDACMNLNNELSYRVEPYDVTEIVPFEEDYLLGFYADVPDVDSDDAFNHASSKAKDVVEKQLFDDIEGERHKVLSSHPTTEQLSEPLLALLPMWFLTFKYKGESYTSIINGQTGKVVAGIPVAKNKFMIFSAIITILSIAISIFVTATLVISNPAFAYIIGTAAVTCLPIGIVGFNNAKRSVMRSKSSTTRIFATKRQEGQ